MFNGIALIDALTGQTGSQKLKGVDGGAATLDVSEITPYVEIVDANANGNTYFCRAYPAAGAASVQKSAAVWRIQRQRTLGTETIYEWADGDTKFDNVYDNRTTLTYVGAV